MNFTLIFLLRRRVICFKSEISLVNGILVFYVLIVHRQPTYSLPSGQEYFSLLNVTVEIIVYQLIDVTPFKFLGDSVVEGANCVLKRGNVTIFKNMNIDTSALTQIQVSKTHDRKSTSIYCIIDLEIMV